MENPFIQLQTFGQSPWYDHIHRAMIENGELAQLIKQDGLKGVTSNPTIYEQAIAGTDQYDHVIHQIVANHKQKSAEDIFYDIAVEDIQRACDVFASVYKKSQGVDGMVSLEVSPELAHDAQATIAQAKKLFVRIDRPNVMIKVPATKAGVIAIEQLIADGLNINATLLFSVDRYKDVAMAYIRGLQQRKNKNLPIDGIASVASFFVSRVDAVVDALLIQKFKETKLSAYQELQGKIAIANAKIAYATFGQLFQLPLFKDLQKKGAKAQRLLWASTGSKNPAFSDVLYVDELIGPQTVSTIPPKTFDAFRDHGKPRASLHEYADLAKKQIDTLSSLGIHLNQITEELERKGVQSFADSYHGLLKAIQSEMLLAPKKAG